MEKHAADYVKEIRKAARTGVAVPIPLETDDRVLARITDGIYRRKPASAIRELIANAYDADATEVVVMTDAPRYSEILVRDNGNGMTAEVLVNLIQHIGGSAKRTHVGQDNGVTDPNDPRLSPGGRRLIGKIGIGLFSVSQLTRQFTIITKPKKEKYRYTAVVTLHHYTDETLGDATNETKFNTGETVITTEEVDGDESHGTTILLGSLIPRARKVLQSREMWSGSFATTIHRLWARCGELFQRSTLVLSAKETETLRKSPKFLDFKRHLLKNEWNCFHCDWLKRPTRTTFTLKSITPSITISEWYGHSDLRCHFPTSTSIRSIFLTARKPDVFCFLTRAARLRCWGEPS